MMIQTHQRMLVPVVLLVSLTNVAQTFGQALGDPCHSSAIEQRVDYRGQKLRTMSAKNEDYDRAAIALAETRLELAKRASATLTQAQQAADNAKSVAVASAPVLPVWQQLAAACVERLQKRLSAEVLAMKGTTAAIRAMLELPTQKFEEQFKAATVAMQRAYESDSRSTQTVRDALARVHAAR